MNTRQTYQATPTLSPSRVVAYETEFGARDQMLTVSPLPNSDSIRHDLTRVCYIWHPTAVGNRPIPTQMIAKRQRCVQQQQQQHS